MMMKERLILGISGSPRKGANTDLMLMEAMKAAETVEGIRTEIIYLRDYEIQIEVSAGYRPPHVPGWDG